MRTDGRVLACCVVALVCGASLSSHARQQVPAPLPSASVAPAGAISGIVTDGSTKRPLPGVVVQLASTGRGLSVARRLITDSKGRFVFQELPASDGYIITTTKFGYLDGGVARRASPGSRISLADAEWIANADIVMWRPGAISGRVVDEIGEPLVGIPVRVLALIPVAGQLQLAAGPIVKTDDRGVYRVAGLSHGNYIVTVPSVQSVVPASTSPATLAGMTPESLAAGIAAGRLSSPGNASGLDVGETRLVIGNYAIPPPMQDRLEAYATEFYPNTRSALTASPVDVKEGEEREGIDFVLQPVSTVRVSGTVVGPPDALTNLVVRLIPEGSENLGVGSEQATALVGAGGGFTFLSVPGGSYVLEAKSTVTELIVRGASIMVGLPATPGMISNSGSGSSIASAPDIASLSTRPTSDDPSWGRLRLRVGTDDLANVVLTMRRGATMSGRISIEGETRPGNLFRVSVDPAKGTPALDVFTPFRPGAPAIDTFTIQGLKDGEYFLRVSAGNGLVVKSIVHNGSDYTDKPFDTSSGADITGVVITLTDKVAALSGIVRDRQGVPVTQAAVVAFPVDKALWTSFGFAPPRIKTTTFFGKGAYKLSGLPKGDYYVVAMDVSMVEAWLDPRFFPAAIASATQVTLNWADAKVQDLAITQVTIK